MVAPQEPIDPPIRDALLVAMEQLLSCNSQGTARGVIVDAYSCIDSCWSALALAGGRQPPHNHKQKLDSVFPQLANELATRDIQPSDIESLYRLWLDVRYSTKPVAPGKAFRPRLIADEVFKCSIASIAATHNTDSRALEEDLYAEHLGSPFQAFGEVIAGIHERFQQDAEAAAEMGYGSRLGNKLMNPFNYCALGLRSADPVTRDILAETTVINDEVAQIYFAFLRMIDKIDAERESRGVEAEQVSNYTLGLSVRFMGAGMSELGKRWAEGIGAALQKFFEERSAPPMPE